MATDSSVVSQLSSVVDAILKERQAHLSAIEEIDATLARYGLSSLSRQAVRSAPKAGRKRGKRSHFAVTGGESILAFVRSRGKSGATTTEINDNWKNEGRKGTAYVLIGKLVKEGKLHREALKGVRGSKYTLS